MLPDIGATELMVIALVALIFVGPKDLPLMLRKLGEFTAKMRRMAADFRTSFDDMARQSELEDLRREVEQMRASATEAISDPIGVGSTFRETMDDVDAALTGDEAFDYDPGVPAIEEPVSSAKPAPKKRAPRKTSGADAKDGSKGGSKGGSKSTRAKAASKAVVAPAEAPAKPRRRVAKGVT
jgi:sec-independent protein translocase protein TatB